MKNVYRIIYQGKPIYVGLTKHPIEQRFKGYYKLIPKEIKSQSIVELIETTEDVSRERYWISEYIKEGYNLYNVYKGCGYNENQYQKENFHEGRAYYETYYKEYWREYKIKNREKYNEYQREYMRSYSKKNKTN